MRRFLSLILSLLISVIFPLQPVFADQITNSLDNTVDASLEALNTTVGAAQSSVNYTVVAQNSDGKQGCNFQQSSTLVVNVVDSNPAAATVDLSSITFGSCGDVKTIHITPVGIGSTNITLSQVSN